MTRENTTATDNAKILALLADRVRAVRAKDLDALMVADASDIVMFDVVNPLQYRGAEATRQRAEEWFSSFDGPIGYEIREPGIVVGGNVAFCHCLNRVKARKTDGEEIEMWWRATLCFRRMRGAWRVVHEHSSVPFDPKTGKAALDLKP